MQDGGRVPIAIEDILSPYGLNQPYSLSLRIQQGKWLLQQEIQIRFPLGCVLLEIKEKENHKTFLETLTNEFAGMSERAAYEHMAFAKKCMELPKLRQFAEANWSKAMTLLYSFSDETIKEIEEKGINGKALEEYDGLSVTEFKALIKKLTKKQDKNPELEAAIMEKNLLQQELEGLRLMVPNGTDASWAANMLAEIEKTFVHLDNYLSSVAFDARFVGDDNLQAIVVGLHARMMDRFARFEQRWEDYTGQEVSKGLATPCNRRSKEIEE